MQPEYQLLVKDRINILSDPIEDEKVAEFCFFDDKFRLFAVQFSGKRPEEIYTKLRHENEHSSVYNADKW